MLKRKEASKEFMEKSQEQWNFPMITQRATSHIVHSANEQQRCHNVKIQGIRTCPHDV
jgi:hypothetical protein